MVGMVRWAGWPKSGLLACLLAQSAETMRPPPPPPHPPPHARTRQGPYITEAGTPVADMWQAEFGHVDKKKVCGCLGRLVGWLLAAQQRRGSRAVVTPSSLAVDCMPRWSAPLCWPPLALLVRSQPPAHPLLPHPQSPHQHMMEMLTLTTRMNALARITLGNVNIAATTALQVGGAPSVQGGMRGVVRAGGRRGSVPSPSQPRSSVFQQRRHCKTCRPCDGPPTPLPCPQPSLPPAPASNLPLPPVGHRRRGARGGAAAGRQCSDAHPDAHQVPRALHAVRG